MEDTTRVAIVGCGKMGQAIIGGLGRTDGFEVVAASVRSEDNAAQLSEQLGLPVFTDNRAAAAEAEMVLLAVKPQVAKTVLAELGDALQGKVLVSICAGVTTDQLAQLAPEAVIVRAMPNTPSLIREG